MTDDLLGTNNSLESRTRAFHAHLDGCAVCRADPFNLCPVGRVLLNATALKDAPKLRVLNLEVP